MTRIDTLLLGAIALLFVWGVACFAVALGRTFDLRDREETIAKLDRDLRKAVAQRDQARRLSWEGHVTSAPGVTRIDHAREHVIPSEATRTRWGQM